MNQSELLNGLNEKNEISRLDLQIFESMGMDPGRYENLIGSLQQIETGVKYFLAQEFTRKDGNPVQLETLLSKLSNNIFGHAVSANAKPERVIVAMKDFVEKTNFA